MKPNKQPNVDLSRDAYMRRVDKKFNLTEAEQREIDKRLGLCDSLNAVETDMQKTVQQQEVDVSAEHQHTHRVFDPLALAALARYASSNENLKNREMALRRLKPDVQLSVLPKEWSTKTDTLKKDWPNFTEVVEQIESDLALSHAMSSQDHPCPVALKPMVMVGPPGCGKSSFLTALADALELPMQRQSLETMMTASDLLGSSRSYSNSEPGLLFNLMTGTGGVAKQMPANFLLALDELDKISGDTRFAPVNALLALLEPSTNKTIMDASAQIAMDLSRLNMIFTANEINTSVISAPLLSRLTVVHIEPLSKEQMLATSQRLYDELVSKFSLPSDRIPRLTDAAVAELASSQSVREQKTRLRMAMGYALKNGLRVLEVKPASCKFKNGKIGFY